MTGPEHYKAGERYRLAEQVRGIAAYLRRREALEATLTAGEIRLLAGWAERALDGPPGVEP